MFILLFFPCFSFCFWFSQSEMIFFSHIIRGAAYINHGDYNVFMVDWGNLCRPPCYVAAVHNLKPVAKCLAHAFSFLRNSGMPVQNTVCVGHSLGSHICGLMANYLDFRIERIIGKLIIGCCFLFSIDSIYWMWMELENKIFYVNLCDNLSHKWSFQQRLIPLAHWLRPALSIVLTAVMPNQCK